MAKSAWQFAKDAQRAGESLAKLPTKNVMAMARVTKDEMIHSQPDGFKRLTKTPHDIAILTPRQRGYAAMTIVAGGFITMITEYGSYDSPTGWTIYPQAYTVAGGKNRDKVGYVGRVRIQSVDQDLAGGRRIRGKFAGDVERNKRRVLAFGATKGGGGAWRFSHSSKRRGIPARPFVAAATVRAQNKSGELYAEQVGKVVAGFR